MKLWRYIQGDRKGKEAHRIEKEAMKDPFLADALEGYEKTEGNHQREVSKLQREITRRQKRITSKSISKKPNHFKALSIAASILIVIGVGTWFLLDHSPIAKDIPQTVMFEEKLVAVSPEADVTRDSVEKIPEKTPIAQATPEKAKKEIQQIEVIDLSEDIQEDAMIAMTEEESAPAPQTPPVMVQEAEAKVAARALVPVSDESKSAEVETEAKQTASTGSDTASPQPVTGMPAYMDYIQRNMKRPTDEECRDVKGAVVVVFKIGQSGRPYNIRVTQGLCSSINKEAIRLIINGPDWKKGQTSDEASITINF